MIIKAYHGTDAKNQNKIEKEGYKASGEKEWLGKGIYFFETFQPMVDGAQEALAWAKFVKRCSRWAVYEAIIKSESFIDLFGNIEHRKLYDKIRKAALEKFEKAGNMRKDFQERKIYITLEETGVDFIRVLVDADKNQGYDTYTVRRPQIQICVKNHRCIIKNTLYKTGERL